MQDWQLVIASVFGGGGVIGVIVKLYDLKRAADKGELEREDTAIGRWKGIAARAEQSERESVARAERAEQKAWRLVAWYRAHYFTARDRLSTEDRKDLPPGPPVDLEI